MYNARKFVLSTLLLAVAGCGDSCGTGVDQEIRSVRILTPLADTIFGRFDDQDDDINNGISIPATVAVFIDDGAGGETLAGDGISVRLRTNQTNEQSAETENGQASFPLFHLLANAGQEDVLNTLQACVTLDDGTELCSEALSVRTDIVGPPCTIVVPSDGTVFDEQDDADQNLLNGFQVPEVLVSTDAGDGTQVVLRVNGAQAGASAVQGSVAHFVQVQLGTNPSLNTLEAECLDQAGNPGTGTSDVTVNVTLPAITITDPLPGTTITTDFQVATFTVQTNSINVEPGQPATLEIDGSTLLGPVFVDQNGNANFTVQLGEGNHTLQARTNDLAGTPAQSLLVDIVVDIIDQPPTVTLLLPDCTGGVANLFAGDDIDNDPSNGVQTQILASSTGTDVDLSVSPGGFADSVAVSGGLAQFPLVTVGVGQNELTLTPFDSGTGLTGTPVVCDLNVVQTDFLTIAEPSDGALLGIAADADNDLGNGFQVRARVTGTSGIVNGTNIDFLVNGALARTKAISGGQVLFDNADAIPIGVQGNVTLTAQAAGGITPDTITVTVDTQPPAQVNNLSCDLQNARDGAIVCTFTAPIDPAPGSGVDKYEVRVLENVAIDENNFVSSARVVATPDAQGGNEVLNIFGARPGPTFHVALVAIDTAGNRSLVSNDAPVKVNGVAGPVTFGSTIVGAVEAGTSGFYSLTMDAVGDFNGDGIDDVVVAAPFAESSQGEVYLYYGAAQDPAATFATPSATFIGNDGFAGLGLAGIGDFDGDSLPDFAIGAPFEAGGRGFVYIFRGRSGAQQITGIRSVSSADFVIANNAADTGSGFGGFLASPGDVDGDGRADLLIGANNGLGGRGDAFLVYGRDLSTPQAVTFPTGIGQEFRGAGATDNFGYVNNIGDINNDGLADIGIGAIQIDGAGNDTGPGYVAIFLGGPRPATPPIGNASLNRDTAFAVITGPAQGEDFGFFFTGLGSIDGDNKQSVMITDRSFGVANQGRVFVFDDITPGTTNAQAATTTIADGTPAADDFLGSGVATTAPLAGRPPRDLDNDGFPDALVLATALNSQFPGGVFLFYGDGSFFGASTLDSFQDADAIIPADGLGQTFNVQFLGDINADGFVDFAIGDGSAASGDGAMQIFF